MGSRDQSREEVAATSTGQGTKQDTGEMLRRKDWKGLRGRYPEWGEMQRKRRPPKDWKTKDLQMCACTHTLVHTYMHVHTHPCTPSLAASEIF